MIFKDHIQTQSRGDKHVLTDNFNSMVGIANALGRFTVDGRSIAYMRVGASGLQIAFKESATAADPIDWSKIAFGTVLSVSTVTVYAGTLRMAGVGVFPVAQENVALSGNPAYVYVKQLADNSATTLEMKSDEPVSNSTAWRFPLIKCTLTGTTYRIDQRLHFGDIHVGTAIK